MKVGQKRAKVRETNNGILGRRDKMQKGDCKHEIANHCLKIIGEYKVGGGGTKWRIFNESWFSLFVVLVEGHLQTVFERK